MLDLIVRGGVVVDGSGGPRRTADVGVQRGEIVGIGPLGNVVGAVEIDATGFLVMPGFIDAHVHGDALVFDPTVQLAALRQGVTTFVLGQDGVSFAPSSPRTRSFVTHYFAAVNGTLPGDPHGGWLTVADLLAAYDGAAAVNAAYLVPAGTVRHEIMGLDPRPATGAETAAMVDLIEGALDDGAVGISTGLEYVPGRFAAADELVALLRPVARRGLPHVTHMRGYEGRAAAALAEVRAIGEGSGAACHVSHLHGPIPELVELVDAARATGFDLTFDSYPYLRGSSILALATMPDTDAAAEPDRVCALLADPAKRAELEVGWRREPSRWERITLSHVPSDRWRWTEGLTLAAAAVQADEPAESLCAQLLLDTRGEAGCVFEHAHHGGDDAVRALLRHPAQLAGSDGIYVGGHPHPRGWGAFARLLGRHVRELGDWTWEEAARHLSGRAAERFGLAGRGVLRLGAAADVVVLDPDRVNDRSTYAQPHRLADGVRHVLVNGIEVLRDGACTGALAGRALRPGRGTD